MNSLNGWLGAPGKNGELGWYGQTYHWSQAVTGVPRQLRTP